MQGCRYSTLAAQVLLVAFVGHLARLYISVHDGVLYCRKLCSTARCHANGTSQNLGCQRCHQEEETEDSDDEDKEQEEDYINDVIFFLE